MIGAGLDQAKGEIEAEHFPLKCFVYREGYLRDEDIYEHIFFALSACFEQSGVDRRNKVENLQQLSLRLLECVVLFCNVDFFLITV